MAHSTKDKDYARFLHEVEGFSLAKTSEITDISVRSLSEYKKRDLWVSRGEKAGEMEAVTRQLYLQEAARNGMTMAKAVRLQVEGMEKPVIETREPQAPGPDGKLQPDKVTVVPDYTTRLKYQQEHWRLAGLTGGGSGGLNVQAGAGGTVNVQVNLPAKVSGDSE